MKTRSDRDLDPALDEQCRAVENAAAAKFYVSGERTLVTPRMMMECISLGMDVRFLDAGIGGRTI